VSILSVLIKRRTFQHPTEDKLIDLKDCMPDAVYG
jgi:hypothetical protein